MVRTLFASLLAVGFFISFAPTADAAKRKKHRSYYGYSSQYTGATPRQLRNARAYERGEYYEMDSNAHPVGSRSWWELKEREGPDRPF
jgi:hypothetical protein